MFPITWTHVILAAIVASICLSGVLARYAYKAIAYTKRMANENAVRPDSVKKYMEPPDGTSLPADVHLQLIINWLNEFKTKCTDRQRKRLSAAFAKLAALDNLRYRTELEMRSHAMNLAVVKRYLFDRCIGMVSVGHQIADDEYRPQNHVRFVEPIRILGTNNDHVRNTVRKISILLFEDVPAYWSCGWSIVKAAFSYFREPVWINKVATAVVDLWKKLLASAVKIDVNEDRTAIILDFLPFFPRRN